MASPPRITGCSVHVKEAYRGLPIRPEQWPGLVVRLDEGDSFVIDTQDCFGLASGCGIYGCLGDAGAHIMQSCGIGPISKWVDDHIFSGSCVATLMSTTSGKHNGPRTLQVTEGSFTMEATFGSKAQSCLTISLKSLTKICLALCVISPRPQKGSLSCYIYISFTLIAHKPDASEALTAGPVSWLPQSI